MKASDDSPDKADEDKVKDDPETKNKEDELSQKRKARHISMGDDNSGKATSADSAQKPNNDTRRAPTAGISLGKQHFVCP